MSTLSRDERLSIRDPERTEELVEAMCALLGLAEDDELPPSEIR